MQITLLIHTNQLFYLHDDLFILIISHSTWLLEIKINIQKFGGKCLVILLDGTLFFEASFFLYYNIEKKSCFKSLNFKKV